MIIHATTGMELNKQQMCEIASNIANLTREFNLREGMGSKDDILPKRFFKEKLGDSGKILLKSEFDTMKSDYYKLRKWETH